MDLNTADKAQLQQWETSLASEYDAIKSKKLNLDLTRGKPSTQQLQLSDALDGILNRHYQAANGIDTRNYGGLEGLSEARELGAHLLELDKDLIIAGGNSSLRSMYQAVMTGYLFGFNGNDSAWKHLERPTFICPVPGYDRHFSVTEHFAIDMITVPMTEHGPDMDAVEVLVANNPSIVGMWCVPKYSNPTGVIYSEDTVDRIAKLGNIANPNFRVFWDNAYAVHDLADTPNTLPNIAKRCDAHSTQDSVLHFASTSKITHAGSGVSFIGASTHNLNVIKKSLAIQTIGPDKTNQLRHAKFLPSKQALTAHMQKHAQILKPRFACVLKHLNNAFSDNNLGQWQEADGGYFVSFDTLPGLAKDVVDLAKTAGVKLTPAGATFPYGQDPNDSNIRIAPSVPSVKELEDAMTAFTCCVKLASVRQALKR